jgi:peptidoglycan/xylan/chitin deacetylase (PgdA/CDA1 family)
VRLRHRAGAAVSLTFDNLGEVTDLERGEWPDDEPHGRHFSVTRALPRILELLDSCGLRATFFVEGLNTELYPDTLRELDAAGHEVAYHGWRHEPWRGLDRGTEWELLERGVRRMGALGIELAGFRPPGGDLTPASLGLLHELGFSYCSPAGDAVRGGEVVVLPFRWPLLDAFHYLPRFASRRERELGSGEPLPPERLRATVMAALEETVRSDGYLSLLFHPFLAEPEERFTVLRDVLARVRALEDERAVWCAPCREVAAALR